MVELRQKLLAISNILVMAHKTMEQKANKRRITDRKVADSLNLSQSTWSNYVNGRQCPNLENSLVIQPWVESLLGVEEGRRFMDLCGYSAYANLSNQKLKIIIDAWPSLSDEQRDHIVRMVDKITDVPSTSA